MNYVTSIPDKYFGSSAELQFAAVHDYAQIYLNGKYVGNVSRLAKNGDFKIKLPTIEKPGKLEVFVEGMGHTNSGWDIETDWKGIERPSMNGEELQNWEHCLLSFKDLPKNITEKDSFGDARPGGIYKAEVALETTADTFFEFTNFRHGVIYVNGHCLGRYLPFPGQSRLFCPGVWLNRGANTVYVVEVEGLAEGREPALRGYRTLYED